MKRPWPRTRFGIHEGRVGRLTFDFWPEDGDADHAQNVHIWEDAFVPLSASIYRHSAEFARPYAWYGVSRVTEAEWRLILADLATFRAELLAAENHLDLELFEKPSFQGGEFEATFRLAFDHMRAGTIQTIDELTAVINGWIETYPAVFIGGI